MLVDAKVNAVPQFGRSAVQPSSCEMPTPRNREQTCVDYKDRVYLNERSRTITYHDSKLDRYDTDTRDAIMEAARLRDSTYSTPPHTFFSLPDKKDGRSCARYNKQHHQAHANQRWHLPFRLLPDEAPGLGASRTGKNNITVAYPN